MLKNVEYAAINIVSNNFGYICWEIKKEYNYHTEEGKESQWVGTL